MGRLIEAYIAAAVPALQDIVSGGIEQPEGATTFPLPPDEQQQGQPIGPGGAPTGPMAALPGPGGINPAAAATPTFDMAAGPGGINPAAGPQPAMPPVEAQQQPDRSGEFEPTPDSFAGMSENASPEDIDNATKAIEKALNDKGSSIDEEHAKVTGSENGENGEMGPPAPSKDDPKGTSKGEGLTRQEKALILMEFGLNLMASSGTGEGTLAGDIGQAGGAALGGHIGRRQASKQAEIDRMEREQKRRLTEAQIKKAETPTATIKTDKDGNFISIAGGVSTPILDAGGAPVSAANVEKFNSEVDRQAYEDLECVDLSGKALKSCKRRALAYGKGGGAKVAFPELERASQIKDVMNNLEDPDRKSAKYHVPSTGQTKRWKDMTPGQQDEVARGFVDRRMRIWENAGEAKAPAAKDPKAILAGLSQEDRDSLKPGIAYTLEDGTKFKMVDGELQIIE